MVKVGPVENRWFLSCLVVYCVVVFAERVFVLAGTQADTTEALWLAAVTLTSLLTMMYLATSSLARASYWEIRAFFIAGGLLLARVVAEAVLASGTASGSTFPALVAFVSCDVLLYAGVVWASWNIAAHLRWRRYKAIGANQLLKQLFSWLELFTACLTLDLQFSLCLLLTGLLLIDRTASPALWSYNIALLVVDFLLHTVGALGVRWKSLALMSLFWLLALLMPAFVVVVAIEASRPNSNLFRIKKTGLELFTVVVIVAAAILNRLASIVVSALLVKSFGEPVYDSVLDVEAKGAEVFSSLGNNDTAQQTRDWRSSRNPRRARTSKAAAATREPASGNGAGQGVGDGAPAAAEAVEVQLADRGAGVPPTRPGASGGARSRDGARSTQPARAPQSSDPVLGYHEAQEAEEAHRTRRIAELLSQAMHGDGPLRLGSMGDQAEAEAAHGDWD